MHIFHRLLCPIIVVTATACQRANYSLPHDQEVLPIVQKLSPFHEGWSHFGVSGGGSENGGEAKFQIKLEGKTYNEAMEELRASLKKAFADSHITITGEGHGSADNVLSSFTLRTQTSQSVATVAVSSAPLDHQRILVVVAVAQASFPKQP